MGAEPEYSGGILHGMTALGELLRQARELKGVSLRDAERATRISRTHLSALESDEFDTLPPVPYARGIVRNYAQYLGLDPRVALDRFQEATGGSSEPVDVVPTARPLEIQSHWAPNFAIIAFMVVMSAIVFAWMYSAYFQPTEAAQPTTVGVATVTPVSPSLLAQVTVQATVATQGGGVATTTPDAMLTPTVLPAASATATAPPPATTAAETTAESVQESAATTQAPLETQESVGVVDENVEDSAATEPSVDETTGDDTDDVAAGTYSFVIWVTEEVWVQAVVDGAVVVDDVLAAGTEMSFSGDSIAVSSGNTAFVLIYVDGTEYGGPDAQWTDQFVYP